VLRLQFTDDAKLRQHVHQHLPTIGQVIGLNAGHPQAAATRVPISQSPMSPGFMAKRNAPRRMPNMRGGVADFLRLLSPDQPHAASDHFDRFFGVPSRHDFHPRLRPNG